MANCDPRVTLKYCQNVYFLCDSEHTFETNTQVQRNWRTSVNEKHDLKGTIKYRRTQDDEKVRKEYACKGNVKEI